MPFGAGFLPPIVVELKGEIADLQAKLAQARGEMQATEKAGGSAFQGLGKVGTMAFGALAVGALAVGAISVKMASDFDTSMTKVAALTGASRKEMDYLTKSVLDLAPAVGKSPRELADALYFVESAGFHGRAAMDILTVSSKASAAGLGDTKVVADAVTSAMNAYSGSH